MFCKPLSEEVLKALHPLAGLRRKAEDLHTRTHRFDTLPGSLPIELYCRGEFILGNHCDVRTVEDRRIFQRLVLALGNRHQYEPQTFAQVIRRRAHEVADVLYE